MKTPLLLYGDTRSNSDMLYLGGIHIHDAFFCFEYNGKAEAVLNPLELGRANKTSKFTKIYDYHKELSLLPSKKRPYGDDCDVLCAILKSKKIKKLRVAYNFPVYYADRLSEAGFNLEVLSADERLIPSRDVKTEFEISEIRKANKVAEAGFSRVREILRQSKIKGKKLYFSGKILTSQFLISEIEKLALSLGADAIDTIAAGGVQACDPHCVGCGAISANSLIVVDIFPRLRASGYYGDMTRTFLKGTPSYAQEKLVNTVLQAQKNALAEIRAGADAANIHSKVCNYFEKNSYKTSFSKGAYSGFFHSTGHGVGLDIHEFPRLSKSHTKLKSGNVVTVEPGLYYSEIGACRIEDTVVVQKGGVKLLSNFDYNWIVK